MSVTIFGSKATKCEYYSDSLQPSTEPVSYERVETIGSGGSSVIVLVRYSEQEAKKWVLKLPLNPEDPAHQWSLKSNTNEAKVLKVLNEQEKLEGREYLIQMIAFFVIKNDPILLFPHYKSDLEQLIHTTDHGFSVQITLDIARQLLEISAFLKRQRVVHRDIIVRFK